MCGDEAANGCGCAAGPLTLNDGLSCGAAIRHEGEQHRRQSPYLGLG